MGRYVPEDGRVELAILPVGGALSFVPLARGEADAFLEGARDLDGSDAG